MALLITIGKILGAIAAVIIGLVINDEVRSNSRPNKYDKDEWGV